MRRLLLLLLFLPLVSQSIQAEERKSEDFFKNLTYPELEVTPRASERLEMEARKEGSGRWWVHSSIQVSALATLYAGMRAKGKPAGDDAPNETQEDMNKYASQFAMAVGAGWLVTTVALSSTYTPYLDGYAKIRKLPTTSVRDQLTRERLAEESIEDAQKLSTRLVYFSVATNLVASLLVTASSEFNVMMVGLGSTLLSFTPIIFEPRWSKVGRQQDDYKKRIYGPVSTFIPVQNPNGSWDFVPGMQLSYNF